MKEEYNHVITFPLGTKDSTFTVYTPLYFDVSENELYINDVSGERRKLIEYYLN